MGKGNRRPNKAPAPPPDIVFEDEASQENETHSNVGMTTRATAAVQEQLDKTRSDMDNKLSEVHNKMGAMQQSIENQMSVMMAAIMKMQPNQTNQPPPQMGSTPSTRANSREDEILTADATPQATPRTVNAHEAQAARVSFRTPVESPAGGATLHTVTAQIHAAPAANSNQAPQIRAGQDTSSKPVTHGSGNEPNLQGSSGNPMPQTGTNQTMILKAK